MFDPQELQQEIFTVSKELSKFPLISARTWGLQQRVGNVEELFCGTSLYVPRTLFLKMSCSAVNSVLVLLLSFPRFKYFPSEVVT